MGVLFHNDLLYELILLKSRLIIYCYYYHFLSYCRFLLLSQVHVSLQHTVYPTSTPLHSTPRNRRCSQWFCDCALLGLTFIWVMLRWISWMCLLEMFIESICNLSYGLPQSWKISCLILLFSHLYFPLAKPIVRHSYHFDVETRISCRDNRKSI